jgi:hypothetical protein
MNKATKSAGVKKDAICSTDLNLLNHKGVVISLSWYVHALVSLLELLGFNDRALVLFLKHVKVNALTARTNWLSVKKAKHCAYSRRKGYSGKIIFGYSIRLRLFNKDLL